MALFQLRELIMKNNKKHFIKGASRIIFIASMFVFLCLIFVALLRFCPFYVRDSSPPDLSDCTRIEIRYMPSTLNYFFDGQDIDNLLSLSEKKYIQSLVTFVMTDSVRIEAFMHDINQGTLYGIQHGKPAYSNPVHIACYRNDKKIVAFTVYGNAIATDSKSEFKYPPSLPNLDKIEPTEIRPFRLRSDCAWNIERLYTAGPLDRRDINSYPEPNQWCDTIMRDRDNTSYVSDEEMRERFKCPSTEEGECHYAMNPNCEPNSPGDMVLLFETRAGWNQHGGPELFNFDNHEPKGGCVLLNDGTVKFIRTEEELYALCWK
jgi:hypothetical protein